MHTMPVAFIGHGSPMNIIEENVWTRTWRALGARWPQPKGIVMISAHWYTRGQQLLCDEAPEMIYDMYGFPQALYDYQYPANNPSWLKERVQSLLPEYGCGDEWGYDHGAYSVLAHLYPQADVPLIQISIDRSLTPDAMMAVGRRLAPLRDEGILLLGSGNLVHNLRAFHPSHAADARGTQFETAVLALVEQGDTAALSNYDTLPGAAFSVPTLEHFAPLLYTVGAARATDRMEVINRDAVGNSLTMTSVLFEPQ